jgi:hypothetical protein
VTGEIPAHHTHIWEITKALFEISNYRNVAVKIEEPNPSREVTKGRKANRKKVKVREPNGGYKLLVDAFHRISRCAIRQKIFPCAEGRSGFLVRTA